MYAHQPSEMLCVEAQSDFSLQDCHKTPVKATEVAGQYSKIDDYLCFKLAAEGGIVWLG